MTDTVGESEATSLRRTREFSELLRHHHRELGTTDPRHLDAIAAGGWVRAVAV